MIGISALGYLADKAAKLQEVYIIFLKRTLGARGVSADAASFLF